MSSAHEQILKLLTKDWLVSDPEVPASTPPIRSNFSLCFGVYEAVLCS